MAEAGPSTSDVRKRKKVGHACLYCKRSHMTCDDARPCSRCKKRGIEHLCRDEAKKTTNRLQRGSAQESKGREDAGGLQSKDNVPPVERPFPHTANASLDNGLSASMRSSTLPTNDVVDTTFGTDMRVLSDFLNSIDQNQNIFASTIPNFPQWSLDTELPGALDLSRDREIATGSSGLIGLSASTEDRSASSSLDKASTRPAEILPADKTETFFLTAADQSDGSRDERLTRVINAKYEAGLLKPYDYVNGYSRLSKYMENNMTAQSRARILVPLSILRPAFRAVAQSLTDYDLVCVEEAFERLLLDYDRVFSTMGIPACLWRRTGEIFKGNKAFAELIGLRYDLLKEGKMTIYELMAEASAVNYWEKYGSIAFNTGQKAVLTSCLLKRQEVGRTGFLTQDASDFRLGLDTLYDPATLSPSPSTAGTIDCCFSFTVRRDRYGCPIAVIGNFLPVPDSSAMPS